MSGTARSPDGARPARRPAVRVREWAGPADSAVFKAVNQAWILRHFSMEPKDLEVLNDPVATILERGGRIFIAETEAGPVGCAALIPMSDGGFELAKMGVEPEAQGRGAGRALIEACVAVARGGGAPRLYLETNSSLGPALHLYRAAGFRELEGRQSPYARADVFMELPL